MTTEEFLTKYEALCREAGMFIAGCGCCDSPFIEPAAPRWKSDEGKDLIADNVAHLREHS